MCIIERKGQNDKMSTLYELTTEYQELLMIAADPEIDPDVLADTMEGIEGEIEIKADGYAKIIRQIEADVAGIKAEEDRLTSRRRSMEANIKRMKESLQAAMQKTGKTKFKTELFSFGIQKNPASVMIAEGAHIPEEYLIQQEPKIDKPALKKALKDGAEFPGITLEQSESLRIR